MPDITYNQFPISGKIVDFDTLQADVANLNANAVLESRTINGYDLSENRTIYAQDVPSKNLLPNVATSKTQNNVTFTVNLDGSVTVSTSGSASAVTYLDLSATVGSMAKSWDGMILTGCPTGGNGNYNITILQRSPDVTFAVDTGSGATISSSSATASSTVEMYIRIASGTTISTPVTFYPMIRPANAPAGYVPYAKTNVELTKWQNKAFTFVNQNYDSSAGNGSYKKFGSYTIPPHKCAILRARAFYLNAAPSGVGIMDGGATWGTYYSTIAKSEESSSVNVTIFTSDTSVTIDLYAKYAGTSNNRVGLVGVLIDMAQ